MSTVIEVSTCHQDSSSYLQYVKLVLRFTFPDTLAHELGDNVNGLLRHDGVELHQLVMTESLHDLSLLQEGLRGHGSWLQSLHRYLGGAVPHAWHTEKRALMYSSEHGQMHLLFCHCDKVIGAYIVLMWKHKHPHPHIQI